MRVQAQVPDRAATIGLPRICPVGQAGRNSRCPLMRSCLTGEIPGAGSNCPRVITAVDSARHDLASPQSSKVCPRAVSLALDLMQDVADPRAFCVACSGCVYQPVCEMRPQKLLADAQAAAARARSSAAAPRETPVRAIRACTDEAPGERWPAVAALAGEPYAKWIRRRPPSDARQFSIRRAPSDGGLGPSGGGPGGKSS